MRVRWIWIFPEEFFLKQHLAYIWQLTIKCMLSNHLLVAWIFRFHCNSTNAWNPNPHDATIQK